MSDINYEFGYGLRPLDDTTVGELHKLQPDLIGEFGLSDIISGSGLTDIQAKMETSSPVLSIEGVEHNRDSYGKKEPWELNTGRFAMLSSGVEIDIASVEVVFDDRFQEEHCSMHGEDSAASPNDLAARFVDEMAGTGFSHDWVQELAVRPGFSKLIFPMGVSLVKASVCRAPAFTVVVGEPGQTLHRSSDMRATDPCRRMLSVVYL